MGTFDIGKQQFAFSTTKPRQNAENILKSFALCIHGDICYVTDFD